ncbi:MAG: class I SAM-dependent methyltransferase [Gammaproteobacteria bacterium]|jgi:SAM-dependent methyltransferase|nr:class I SAM-dependent methyltransferase [Gammaproteobacteria bacterium]
MDILEYNRQAWNRESLNDGEWSVPVSEEIISAARNGAWQVVLTPLKPVPKSWFGNLHGKKVLCLASGGGQQAPVLAAAGAIVVSFDLSDVQLEKDRMLAKRHKLDITCIRGDMADLSQFAVESFDLIFHPVSNVFVPDVEIVWQQCYRVLKPKGDLLAGFMNPSLFLFDHDESERSGKIEVKYKLPYAEPDSLDQAGLKELEESGRALEFSHSLQTQIGGQLKAGFVIADLYEDYWPNAVPLSKFSPTSIATRATKP